MGFSAIYGVGGGGQKFQVDLTAVSADRKQGKLFQHIGATTAAYTYGCWYTSTKTSAEGVTPEVWEWIETAVDDYNILPNTPIVNQDLSSVGFSPVANTYYKHIGTTTASYTQGIIYLYDGTNFISLTDFVKYKDILLTLTIIDQTISLAEQTITVANAEGQTYATYTTAYPSGTTAGNLTMSVRLPIGFSYTISSTVTGSLAGYNFDNLVGVVTETMGTLTGAYQSIIEQIQTVQDLQNVVNNDATLSALKTSLETGVQTSIIIPWYDNKTLTTYNLEWNIVEVRNSLRDGIVDENGIAHKGVYLQLRYATPFSLEFDAPEKVLASTLTQTYVETISGTMVYYYDNTGKLLVAGTDFNYGDAIGSTTYINDIEDISTGGWIGLFGAGYAKWSLSNLRQWLNSSGNAGSWFVSQHIGDSAPSYASNRDGFMKGFSVNDLQFFKKSRVITPFRSADDLSYDYFFIQSISEMYGTQTTGDKFFEYWKQATGESSPTNSPKVGRIVYNSNPTDGGVAKWLRQRNMYSGSNPRGYSTMYSLSDTGAPDSRKWTSSSFDFDKASYSLPFLISGCLFQEEV